MPFDCGVAPPKSKYNYDNVQFGGVELCKETGSDDDTDLKWMCTSMADAKLKEIEEKQKNSADLATPDNDSNLLKHGRFSDHEWLEKIEDKYFDERDDLVRQLLQAAYDDVRDVYAFLLHVIFKGFFDLYSKRIPISYYAMDELDIWLKLKEQYNEPIPKPLESHKRQAGEFVCRSGYNYLDKLNKLFQLDKGDNSCLAKFVNLQNLKSKKLKETAIIIYTLKLQHNFDTNEIALPLIANDQLQVLETYVGGDKVLQKTYVELLHEICKMTEEEVKEWTSLKGLQMKDASKMKRKTVIKIAEKAVKRYDLNPDEYPGIFSAKNKASLNYLVRKRFKEVNASGENSAAVQKWDQLIETSVSESEMLQKQLIKILVDWNELGMALNWCEKLDLPFKRLAPEIRDELKYFLSQETSNGYSTDDAVIEDEYYDTLEEQPAPPLLDVEPTETEDWDDYIHNGGSTFSIDSGFSKEGELPREEDFYTLKLSEDKIILVDDIEKLKKTMSVLFKSNQIIGFDSEWKSNICKAGQQDRISILQLAITDRVYILDLFQLYVMKGAETTLQEFFQRFFTSSNVVKIGFGINGDLKILMGMFLYVKDYVLSARHLVDLCNVSQKILSHPLVIPYLYPARKAALAEKGLSLLVNRTLGKKLDKTFQVSDWERRPLSEQQLCYAALDAYCLLECYTFLQKVSKEVRLKVNLTENTKLKWLKPQKKEPKRKDKYDGKSKHEMAPDNHPLFKGPPRRATSLKVVCDTMLQGLGRQLRLCGVDTRILNNSEDHSSAIMISHRENRVILTRGQPYFMFRGHVGENMCMFVPDGSLKEQMKMVFTRYNVAVQTKDIFSRCMECNSDKYSYIPPDELKLAYDLKNDINDAEMPETQLTLSKVIDLSNFTLAKNGVELQLDTLPNSKYAKSRNLTSMDSFFQTVDLFYVCEGCGKIYWEGTHMNRVKINFKDLIDKRETDKTFYGKPG